MFNNLRFGRYTMAKSIIGILAVLFAFFQFADSYSQTDSRSLPKSNFALFSEITNEGLDELYDAVTVLGKDKIYKVSFVGKSDETAFLMNVVKQRFSSYNFIYEKDDGYNYKIVFSNAVFSVSYSEPVADNVLGNEYFMRDLKAGFNYSVLHSDSGQKRVSKTFKDKVYSEYFEYIQENGFGFMRAELPDKPFMKKILVPAIIVALSAVTAILFFTIRSK